MTAALDVSELLVSTLLAALNLDAEPLLKRIHLRRRALVASIQRGPVSPMDSEDFRAAPPARDGGGGGGDSFGLRRDG